MSQRKKAPPIPRSKEHLAVAGTLAPLVSLLLFLCSQREEVGVEGHRPGNPAAKRTKKGWRWFPADKLTTWDVGVRIGAALRRAYQRAETGQAEIDPETGRARPRAHVRRAHWHGYWTGPRVEERAAERRFPLRWMPPIPVNLDSPDDLPATVRRVRDTGLPGRPPLAPSSEYVC